MAIIAITNQVCRELKNVKDDFNRASKLYDEGQLVRSDYYEAEAVKNVAIYAKKLDLTYNQAIDLIFDFDYTITLLPNLTYQP